MDTETLQAILFEVIFQSHGEECKENLSLSHFAQNTSPMLAKLKKERVNQYYYIIELAEDIYIRENEFWNSTTYRHALIATIARLLKSPNEHADGKQRYPFDRQNVKIDMFGNTGRL